VYTEKPTKNKWRASGGGLGNPAITISIAFAELALTTLLVPPRYSGVIIIITTIIVIHFSQVHLK